ncbi:hypothetical protein [Streptomyces sp. LMG1-1-1.1]
MRTPLSIRRGPHATYVSPITGSLYGPDGNLAVGSVPWLNNSTLAL